MITAQCLAAQWIELFNTNTSKPFHNKQFMAKHTAIDTSVRKLSDGGKQKFSDLIHQGIRVSLSPSKSQ